MNKNDQMFQDKDDSRNQTELFLEYQLIGRCDLQIERAKCIT